MHATRTALVTFIAFIVAAAALVALTPATASAQASVEVRGKAGVTSATIDNTARAGDPVFNPGGGFQAAALLRFKGGIAGGLNFNYQYDGHAMTAVPSGFATRPSISYNQPSMGIRAMMELMPSIHAGGWANYVFGSTTVDAGQQKTEWDNQGFEIGGDIQLNYQLKPYKTYLLMGAYAYMQYLSMFATRDDLGYGDMSGQNIGIGATLGVRMDFKL